MITKLQLAILVALTSEPLTGYGASQQIRLDSNSTFIPSHQSVYYALASLERDHLIEAISRPQYIQYQLTAAGRRRLNSERQHLELMLQHLRSRS